MRIPRCDYNKACNTDAIVVIDDMPCCTACAFKQIVKVANNVDWDKVIVKTIDQFQTESQTNDIIGKSGYVLVPKPIYDNAAHFIKIRAMNIRVEDRPAWIKVFLKCQLKS